MHWSELDSLFDIATDSRKSIRSSERHQNIVCNPHLADWYFTFRMEKFVRYWLKDSLDAAWHWFRFEYQANRCSIDCDGTAKLKNDPGLCDLTNVALKGFLVEENLYDATGIICQKAKSKL